MAISLGNLPKKEGTIYLGIGVFTLILVLIFTNTFTFPDVDFNLGTLTGSQFCALSLSDAVYKTSTTSDPYVLVTATAGGCNQNIVGSVYDSGSDFLSSVIGGKTVESKVPVDISVKINKNSCEYSLTQYSNSQTDTAYRQFNKIDKQPMDVVMKYNPLNPDPLIEPISCGTDILILAGQTYKGDQCVSTFSLPILPMGCTDEYRKICERAGGKDILCKVGDIEGHMCLKEKFTTSNTGYYSSGMTPTVELTGEVAVNGVTKQTFKINDKNAVITNTGTPAPLLEANLAGGLISYNTVVCPPASDITGYKTSSMSSVYLVDDKLYGSVPEVVFSNGKTIDALNTEIGNHNTKVNSLLSSHAYDSQDIFKSSVTPSSDITITTSKLTINRMFSSIPVITLKLDAQDVGIYTANVAADISCSGSYSSTTAGSSKSFPVTLTNKGDPSTTVNLRFTCPNVIITNSNPTLTLGNTNSQTPYTVAYRGSEEGTEDCRVEVVSGSSVLSSCLVDMVVSKECSQGTKPSGNYQWNSDTCSWQCVKKTCASGQIWSSSQCDCIQGGCTAPLLGCGLNKYWDASTCSCKDSGTSCNPTATVANAIWQGAPICDWQCIQGFTKTYNETTGVAYCGTGGTTKTCQQLVDERHCDAWDLTCETTKKIDGFGCLIQAILSDILLLAIASLVVIIAGVGIYLIFFKNKGVRVGRKR